MKHSLFFFCWLPLICKNVATTSYSYWGSELIFCAELVTRLIKFESKLLSVCKWLFHWHNNNHFPWQLGQRGERVCQELQSVSVSLKFRQLQKQPQGIRTATASHSFVCENSPRLVNSNGNMRKREKGGCSMVTRGYEGTVKREAKNRRCQTTMESLALFVDHSRAWFLA